jgi:hypothetical protein
MDIRRCIERIDKATPIELQRHYQINDELWHTEQQYSKGQIGKPERDKRIAVLRAEERDAIIEFETEADFAEFCMERGGPLLEEYRHEEEHATIYRKYGVPCKFGFIKFTSRGHHGLIPWVTPCWQGQSTRERLEITLEALKNATEKSPGDLQDIAALQKILGNHS